MPLENFTSLIATDFDGTVIDPESETPFPQELGSAIQALQEKGSAWAICTGRSLNQANDGILQYCDPIWPDFLISSERQLYIRNRFHRWVPLGKWNSREAKDHQKLFKGNRRFFKKIRNYIEKETSARYIATDHEPAGIIATDDAEMYRICTHLDEILPKVPTLGYERNSIYLRFSHNAYSKGTTLAELTRTLGLAPQAIFAAGDNYNDLSMLDKQHAEMLACPHNANDTVKNTVTKAGGHVSEKNCGQGVLEALKHFFP